MVNAYRPRKEPDETSTRSGAAEADADVTAAPGIDVEHEVVIPRYPREFSRIKAKARYLGPGKPQTVLDSLADDE
jgi:hypothetical protein